MISMINPATAALLRENRMRASAQGERPLTSSSLARRAARAAMSMVAKGHVST